MRLLAVPEDDYDDSDDEEDDDYDDDEDIEYGYSRDAVDRRHGGGGSLPVHRSYSDGDSHYSNKHMTVAGDDRPITPMRDQMVYNVDESSLDFKDGNDDAVAFASHVLPRDLHIRGSNNVSSVDRTGRNGFIFIFLPRCDKLCFLNLN